MAAVKINLSTPASLIWETMEEEINKAYYWYCKKSSDKKERNIIGQAFKTRKDQIGEIIDYTSTAGNRWISFFFARYIPETDSVHHEVNTSLVYETADSCGVFFISNDNHIMIFTSHFFQRWCDRNLGKMEGINTIKTFLTQNPHYALAIYDDEGQTKVDVRMPNCIGRGYVRHGENGISIYEIRTVLSDEMLTNKQKKDTKGVREFAEAVDMVSGSKEESMIKMLRGYDKARSKGKNKEYMQNMYNKMGILMGKDANYMEYLSYFIMGMCTIFFYIDPNTDPYFMQSDTFLLDRATELMNFWIKNKDADMFERKMAHACTEVSKHYNLGFTKSQIIDAMELIERSNK